MWYRTDMKFWCKLLLYEILMQRGEMSNHYHGLMKGLSFSAACMLTSLLKCKIILTPTNLPTYPQSIQQVLIIQKNYLLPVLWFLPFLPAVEKRRLGDYACRHHRCIEERVDAASSRAWYTHKTNSKYRHICSWRLREKSARVYARAWCPPVILWGKGQREGELGRKSWHRNISTEIAGKGCFMQTGSLKQVHPNLAEQRSQSSRVGSQ